jgi:hypothetical protein
MADSRRERELDEIRSLFWEGKRFVTVTGIGDRQDLPDPAAVLERQ